MNNLIKSIVLLFFVNSVFAEDKALLIGVGKHQDPRNDLPGIDLDIKNMQQTVKQLGFTDIKILENSEATEKNIKFELKWLSQGTSKNDRVLIYFSGHGSQMKDRNGDEEDGLDEFWVAHDFNVTGGRAKGYILDDDVNKALKNIRSDNVYVFVDACQSGTSTRGLTIPAFGQSNTRTKFLSYPGMPRGESKGIAIEEAKSSDNFVALSAARDTEYALAGRNGSYFTLGLVGAVKKSLNSKDKGITPKKLHQSVVKYVADLTHQGNRFTPQLSGNTRLQNKILGYRKVENEGIIWQEFEAIESYVPNKLSVSSNKSKYRKGDQIVLDIDVPSSGYLNVVSVDANDVPIVLFPNEFQQDNFVRKGRFKTSNDLDFVLKASDPLGKNLTVALLTKEPLNLYEKSTFGRDANGNLKEVVVGLDAVGMKEIEIRSRGISVESNRNQSQSSSGDSDGVWIGKIITNVTR